MLGETAAGAPARSALPEEMHPAVRAEGGRTAGGGRLIEPRVRLDEVALPEELRRELEELAEALPRLGTELRRWGLDRLMPSGRGLTVLVAGPPGTGKSMLAEALAARMGRRLLAVDGGQLAEAGRWAEASLDELWETARREAALPLVEGCEAVLGAQVGSRLRRAMLEALARLEGLVLLETSAPERLDGALEHHLVRRIELGVPPPPLRARIWQRLLPPELPRDADVNLETLAKRYDFAGGFIKNAVLLGATRMLGRGGASLAQADLEAGAEAQLRGDLASWAERTRPLLSLDLLVLPGDVKAQIEEVIAAGRNRAQVLYGWGFHDQIPTGKGQVVLLSGEPGTGKTLSAEVIAAELGMSLYRINPAKVVSKYVGETEKNLDQLLGQARSLHAILFFDEADALFASRVQRIESANDRFVNLETNFLLQQLERFEGMVILATNLETTIDQAFKRRIHHHIVIPFPDAEARAAIWRKLMPARAPLASDIDYALLGKRFDLAGGHIKNAVLRAAYLAAQRGVPLSLALLLEAGEKECAAAGKLFQSLPIGS